jgi:hypothetical protein
MQRTGVAPAEQSITSDRDLLSRARRGDAAAFGAIARTRLPGAYRLARAILASDDAAADAVTNALVAAWAELPRLSDLDRFDDWLDRILISECRMRLGSAGPGLPGAVMPADLPDRALRAIDERAATGGTRASRRSGDDRRWVAAAGVLVLVVALIAAGAIGGLFGPNPGAPEVAGLTSSSQHPGGAPGSPATGPGGSSGVPLASPSGATPPIAGDEFAIGSLVAVTLQGDNLRVRNAPGVGDASKRLKPVLPAGTRMLIVDGPVQADGYDWYEVQTDAELIDLFGWVAAGKDGAAWIAPAAPRCGDIGPATIARLSRVDFLACYGRTEVKVRARAEGLWDATTHAGDCGWVRTTGTCRMDNPWLLLPAAHVTLIDSAGEEHDITVAMPPELSTALAKVARQSTLLLTIAMDDPEAGACHVEDAASGKALIPDDEAVTACRLQFVVQEVAFRDPGSVPSPSAAPTH